ncbi:CBO0543 family protein [Bacillus sp. SD088]|uniref:CBO0543 family protein n=1 Tax=Bacillus sp. SD088 TaxID=2782012 RepID=UPI001F620A1B|nr:CBO0543 family protein [Bacillus sp. SD088]
MIIAIVVFNVIALLKVRNLSINQIVHIIVFTIAFQTLVDLYLDFKYHAYWYYSKAVDLRSIPTLIMIIPAVNVMFLNWYPLERSLMKQTLYIICWTISLLMYESFALLPGPWGYFHYGWWKLGYSAIVDPILLITLVLYYKWIRKIEKNQAN